MVFTYNLQRLRKKLEGAESVIVTVRGLGYKLVAGP